MKLNILDALQPTCKRATYAREFKDALLQGYLGRDRIEKIKKKKMKLVDKRIEISYRLVL